LIIESSLELRGWNLGFPQSAVAREKTAALEGGQLLHPGFIRPQRLFTEHHISFNQLGK
jgi:hypothetical protein